jgi:hypothetical protein
MTEELLERTTASSPIPVIETVGLATIKMYIAAIVDFFNEQCMADPYSNRPHPRGKHIEILLKELDKG